MFMASHSRSSIACLLYLSGNCHHSRLPVAVAVASDTVGVTREAATASTVLVWLSEGTFPFLDGENIRAVLAGLEHET